MTSGTTQWKRTNLGSVGRYFNGRAFKKSEWATHGRPIVRIQNLTGTSREYNYFKGDLEDRYVARTGDLLVSWAATLGAFIWTGPDAAINQHIFKVESNIDRKFHKYLLDFKLAELMRETHGSGIVHITRGKFDAVLVELPPRDEQRRIVDILEDHLSHLDAAEAGLVTTRRRLVAYQRAALDKLTEGAATRRIALGDALAGVEAGRSFGGATRPSSDDEWGIVKVSSMTWGEFRPSENKLVSDPSKVDLRYQIHAGDLLMSRANTSEYVGAPVLVRSEPARLLLSDKSLRLIPRVGVSAEYLWRVLSAPRAREQISARASGNQDSMRNISQATLKTIEIPWTDHQDAVSGAANDIDDQHARLSAAIDRSRTQGAALRRALLQAAFSGRLTDLPSDPEQAEEAVA